MNKKGAIEDVLFIVISLFTLAIVLLIGVWLANTFNTSVAPTFGNLSANSTIGFTKVNEIANNTFNYIYLIVFFLFLILLIISSFMTPTHPIFFIFSIVLFVGLLIASVIMSNLYESLSAVPAFATAASRLTIPAYIMANLPLITAAIGVLLSIIIYSRTSNPYGEGAVTR